MKGRGSVGPEFFTRCPRMNCACGTVRRVRILLDTHTLLWAAFDEDSLSPRARAIQSLTAKSSSPRRRRGRLRPNFAWGSSISPGFGGEFHLRGHCGGYLLLSISPEHALGLALPGDHKDPSTGAGGSGNHENIRARNDSQLDVSVCGGSGEAGGFETWAGLDSQSV